MGFSVNTNSTASNTYLSLSKTDSKLSKSIQRLSSGYKINTAADDPAGLVISEKLKAQVGGVNQAITNASNATNLVKTAEGALTEVNSLLSSIRDLAVAASNAGASDEETVAAYQTQIDNALESIDKISQETQYGTKNLLDGSAGVKSSITGEAVTGSNLNSGGLNLDTDDYTDITVTQVAQQATVSSAAIGTATETTVALTGEGTFELTGSTGASVEIDYDTSMTIGDLMDAINAKTDTTGVAATFDTTTHAVVFTTEDYGSNASIAIADATGNLMGSTSVTDEGQNVEATVKNSDGELVSDVVWASGNGLTLKDSNGNTIDMTETGATTATAYTTQVTTKDNSLTFQVGAYSGQSRTVSVASVSSKDLGSGVVSGSTLADINVTTASGAQNALDIVDKAISQVSSIRANLGAFQTNTLDTTTNSLSVAAENLSSSVSTITDTDMATEITNMTQYQILEQAGISMLSQANSVSQNLLSLLQ
ncbi:hypothetical protein LLG46_07385 [bacterium]|nr:hypothetical protein [bacterium]